MSEIKIGARVKFTNPEVGEPKLGTVIDHNPTRDPHPNYTGNREWFVHFDEPLFGKYEKAFCAGRELEVVP